MGRVAYFARVRYETNAAYYDRFKARVDVAEHIGVSFNNPVLWDWKSQELYGVGYDLLSDPVKEAKVVDPLVSGDGQTVSYQPHIHANIIRCSREQHRCSHNLLCICYHQYCSSSYTKD